MPSNNSKYTPEFREETARFIVESRKSASSVAEEIGIDKNTVCSWVRDYRRKNGLPSYAEEMLEKHLNPEEFTSEQIDYFLNVLFKKRETQDLLDYARRKFAGGNK